MLKKRTNVKQVMRRKKRQQVRNLKYLKYHHMVGKLPAEEGQVGIQLWRQYSK